MQGARHLAVGARGALVVDAAVPLFEPGFQVGAVLENVNLEEAALGVAHAILDGALLLWSARPGRVGHDAGLGAELAEGAIPLHSITIAAGDDRLRIVEDRDQREALEVAERVDQRRPEALRFV
jgi:hypothetical protein